MTFITEKGSIISFNPGDILCVSKMKTFFDFRKSDMSMFGLEVKRDEV